MFAFSTYRWRRGEQGRDLDLKEAKLRYDAASLNQRGVWLGNGFTREGDGSPPARRAGG